MSRANTHEFGFKSPFQMNTSSRRLKAPSELPIWAAGPGVWAPQDPCFRDICSHSTLICVCQLEACRSRYVQQCHIMSKSEALPQSPFHATLPKAQLWKLHTYMHGSEAAICVSGHVLVCSRRVVQRFTGLRNEEVSDLWWVSVCLSKLAAAFSSKPSFILVRTCFQKGWPAIRQPDCIPGC